jgi:GDPmannose 4,6-dehydratase
MSQNKKALIVGISGQDGAYLAELLLNKGYKVWGTSRDHEASSFQNLEKLKIKHKINLCSMVTSDFRSVISTLQKSNPTEIYNLAGQTSVGMSFTYPIETFESILIGTMNLLEAIRLIKIKTKYYNAGSSEAFGNVGLPADEKTPYHPRSPYATAKAASHYAVSNYREAYSLFSCTGILFNHESPLRHKRFVTKKVILKAIEIAQGSRKKLELGDITIERDWGWAPEYVEAMWKIMQNNEPDDFIIATGVTHSLENFVATVFRYFNMDWRKHVVIKKELFRPSDIAKSHGNPKKAEKKLGWSARVSFDALVKKLVEAELAEKSLPALMNTK